MSDNREDGKEKPFMSGGVPVTGPTTGSEPGTPQKHAEISCTDETCSSPTDPYDVLLFIHDLRQERKISLTGRVSRLISIQVSRLGAGRSRNWLERRIHWKY